MRSSELDAFKELDEAGVFVAIFDKVREDITAQWQKAESAEAREELWQRQRALRDVRRAFNSQGGLDA